LVIAPSKTDRERIIPMSAELFAVVAAIIRRHTQQGRPVPLIQRYDNHERRSLSGHKRAFCARATRTPDEYQIL